MTWMVTTWMCKEDVKKYFGNKQFISKMEKHECGVCGKDKDCYEIPFRVSKKKILSEKDL